MHPFDASIELAVESAHDTLIRYTGATHPVYANMVGPFGGTTAAVLLQAVLQHPLRQGTPVAQTVNYAAPVADGPYVVEATALRTNRSTQHFHVVMLQADEVVASSSAVLAVRRESWSALEAPPPPAMPAPDTLPRFAPEGRPPWVRAYDMRFRPGPTPMTFDGVEQADALTEGWVRDDPPRPLDFPSLAAICDSFFPRVMIRRRRYGPIGTITMSTIFHADSEGLAAVGDRHVLGVARALNYSKGYFDQRAEVWSDQGALLATSQQLVYFKDASPA